MRDLGGSSENQNAARNMDRKDFFVYEVSGGNEEFTET
jgi:hypothetical protein